MAILEKLMERKDLLAYLKFRTQELENEVARLPDKIDDPQNREPAIRQVKGRIKELRQLRRIMAQRRLKEASKRAKHRAEKFDVPSNEETENGEVAGQ